MKVPPNQWANAWDAMIEDRYDNADRKLLVFASSAEVDSVCAVRILQRTLALSEDHYSIIPVCGYKDLVGRVAKELENDGDEDPRSILLVNCGGTEDIFDLLPMKAKTRVFVLDAHRPLHLKNLSDQNQSVFVFWDEEAEGEDADDLPIDAAFSEEEGDDPQCSSDDDGDMDDLGNKDAADSQGGGDEHASGPVAIGHEDDRQGERMVMLGHDKGGHTAQDGDDGGSGSDAEHPRKRQRQMGRKRGTEERAMRRIEYYLRGMYYGKPTSLVAFQLAEMLHKDDTAVLWMAIVGLTDQLLHGHIADSKYQEFAWQLNERVGHNKGGTDLSGAPGVKTWTFGRISAEYDLRFSLLRHWSLFEAMKYSSYVAARLGTWTDSGRRSLELLLAKMGIPLDESRRSFSSMRSGLRMKLPEKFEQWCQHFRMYTARFWSFRLEQGLQKDVSASDCVYAATALLERSDTQLGTNIDGFWDAWRALSLKSCDDLERGIRLSKALLRSVHDTAGQAIIGTTSCTDASSQLVRAPRFWLLDLSEQGEGQGEDSPMHHPLALTKVGLFLQEYQLQRTGRRPPPMVVAGPPNAQDMCCVVGLKHTMQDSLGDAPEGSDAAISTSGNVFSYCFEQACKAVNAIYSHDSFVGAWILISRRDVTRFANELIGVLERGHGS